MVTHNVQRGFIMNTLKQAVIEQLGYNEDDLDQTSVCYEELTGTLSDIANYGISGGFSGFIYYTDTIKFFDDNRDIILRELSSFADDIGESVTDMVRGFNCLDDDAMTHHEIDNVLMNLTDNDDTQVKNALAWWAAEHVAHQFQTELEQCA